MINLSLLNLIIFLFLCRVLWLIVNLDISSFSDSPAVDRAAAAIWTAFLLLVKVLSAISAILSRKLSLSIVI